MEATVVGLNRLWIARKAAREAKHTQREGLAAETLYAQYLDVVYRYVARRVHPPEEAEDITAEVFAAAIQMLPRFRGECRPETWLLGIANRKVADTLRRRQRRRETLTTDLGHATQDTTALLDALLAPTASPEVQTLRAEAQQLVRALVNGLKSEQREALLLQYVEELSVAEIAIVMRKSPAAVNSLLQRARQAISRQARGYFTDERERR
jgi:RNA polymerase sigma-70 factor, ECF subfamily